MFCLFALYFMEIMSLQTTETRTEARGRFDGLQQGSDPLPSRTFYLPP